MLSIVTINYNNVQGLLRTLKSLTKQNDFQKVELVVVDGGSSDDSFNLIVDYANKYNNIQYISERDDGIYDAMNKGIDLSTRDYVSFLNSGDVLSERDIIRNILEVLARRKLDVIYSDLKLLSMHSNKYRSWVSGEFSKYKLFYGWMPPHPMTVVNKKLLNNFGKFDMRFKIAADYHLLLKIFLMPKVEVFYLKRCSVIMEAGGVSNSSIRAILTANLEVLKAWYDLIGVFCPFWIFFTKPALKLFQYRPHN